MTFEEAKGLLKLSREARWSYPPSQGGDMARSLAAKALELTRGLDPSLGQAPLFMDALSTRMLADYDTAADLFSKSVELN